VRTKCLNATGGSFVAFRVRVVFRAGWKASQKSNVAQLCAQGGVVFKVLLSLSLSLSLVCSSLLTLFSLLSSKIITVRVKDRFSVPTRTRVRARRSTEPRTLPKDTGTLKAS